jgi:DNA-binding NarL/FixJ family response regulator
MEPTLPLITVIVVNRQRSVCEHWKQLFDGTPGMSCPDYALDGKTAIRLVHEVKPKVVLMDTHLSDMSAEEVMEIIATDSPETVIVMYSEESDGAQIAEKLGADEFLTIPVPQKTLINAINQAYHDKQGS